MGRPSRIQNDELAREVSEHLSSFCSSVSSLARELGVQPSTLSRSIATQSFSRDLALRLRSKLKGDLPDVGKATALRKALHLLDRSDKLRARAEKLIKGALDQAIQTK